MVKINTKISRQKTKIGAAFGDGIFDLSWKRPSQFRTLLESKYGPAPEVQLWGQSLILVQEPVLQPSPYPWEFLNNDSVEFRWLRVQK